MGYTIKRYAKSFDSDQHVPRTIMKQSQVHS